MDVVAETGTIAGATFRYFRTEAGCQAAVKLLQREIDAAKKRNSEEEERLKKYN